MKFPKNSTFDAKKMPKSPIQYLQISPDFNENMDGTTRFFPRMFLLNTAGTVAMPFTGGLMSRTDPKTPNTEQGSKRSNKNKPILPRICVSAREAAEASGLSKSTIYNCMADKRLPFIKIGQRRLIMLKDLEDFLENNRQR